VRVEHPFELAAILLDASEYDADSIAAIIASKKRHRVVRNDLPEVLLVYWTAATDVSGSVYFFNDVYERDDDLIARLDQPFEYDPAWLQRFYDLIKGVDTDGVEAMN
jgi:murein L,D-transpeptidase YcbB/YkuD